MNLQTNPALAIDIGGTNTKLGIVDKIRGPIAQISMPTEGHHSFELFGARLKIKVSELMAQAQVQALCGMGVGAPDVNFYTGKMVNPPNLSWGTFSLAEEIQKLFSYPVWVDNDANLFALGEWRFGRAKGLKNFILLTLGTGVGTGLAVEGKLVRGHNGLAAEGGHSVVLPEGRACGCGGRGHLEAYLGARGLMETAFEITGKKLTPPEISLLFSSGDAKAVQVVEYSAHILAMALANWVNLIGPELIILTGGLSHLGPKFSEATQTHLERHLFHNLKNSCQITLGDLSPEHGALLGAAALVFDQLNA